MNRKIESMYQRLVSFLLKEININENLAILEGGCGRGQLTIPLILEVEKKSKIIDILRWISRKVLMKAL